MQATIQTLKAERQFRYQRRLKAKAKNRNRHKANLHKPTVNDDWRKVFYEDYE